MDFNASFAIKEDGVLPCMTITCGVIEKRRREAPAVAHVDGTARLQLISRNVNPKYFKLGELALLVSRNCIVT